MGHVLYFSDTCWHELNSRHFCRSCIWYKRCHQWVLHSCDLLLGASGKLFSVVHLVILWTRGAGAEWLWSGSAWPTYKATILEKEQKGRDLVSGKIRELGKKKKGGSSAQRSNLTFIWISICLSCWIQSGSICNSCSDLSFDWGSENRSWEEIFWSTMRPNSDGRRGKRKERVLI